MQLEHQIVAHPSNIYSKDVLPRLTVELRPFFRCATGFGGYAELATMWYLRRSRHVYSISSGLIVSKSIINR